MANADGAVRSVQSVYAERFAADLAANRSEQEEITGRIAELQTRLDRLREDEKWLSGMQGTLPAPAAKSVPRPRPAKARKKTAAPQTPAPLHQLVLALLPAGEPRLVREVHADLEKAHPDRTTSVQVVRNTLETLVKRGAVTKGTQKGSAMYTAPQPAAEAAGGKASAGA
ncbi:hypothetical protein [Streptomyces sp. ITFR-16]|uniref:hypothetical protein n=1 Tax=Streptomyces sp. ITFR-16 TaxID=3075198 RepID=UPI00288B72D8|nr:hypothetical protein [Streptomyces sp. ITFR-16]WNI20591.1 hypothetical protein RLT58_01080 [Streptomyces sp. ITFR-16]